MILSAFHRKLVNNEFLKGSSFRWIELSPSTDSYGYFMMEVAKYKRSIYYDLLESQAASFKKSEILEVTMSRNELKT